MKNKLYLFPLLLFIACKSSGEAQLPEPKETITIGKGEKVKLSQLIHSFEYITLEEKEIIGNIFDLKIQDKDIYIHDDISKSVLKFDSAGNYQYKIHRVGKGPGEYVMIVDFLVNNNKVEIFNTGNNKRIVFDENGAFITQTKMNSYGWKHAYLNESTILAYNTPGDLNEEAHYLYLWNDVITEILDKKLPFVPDKDKMLPAGLYPFSNYKNTVNFCADFSDMVYSINQKRKLLPKYQLNFTHYKRPTEEVYKKYTRRNPYEWHKGMKPYAKFLRFIESDNYCYTKFHADGGVKNFFYSKKNKTGICVEEFIDDMGLGTTKPDIVKHENGNWYAILRVSEMSDLKTLKDRRQAVSEEAEFILLKFKLR